MGPGVAGRGEDFSCWIQLTAKQRLQTSRPRTARLSLRAAGTPNPVTDRRPVTGMRRPRWRMARRCSAVLRFPPRLRHRPGAEDRLPAGRFPPPSPAPAARHDPMDEWRPERTGRYRPTVPKRIPRAIPDDWFNKLFASLDSGQGPGACRVLDLHRDQGSQLWAYSSATSGPKRAQLVSVIRKDRGRCRLPASADASYEQYVAIAFFFFFFLWFLHHFLLITGFSLRQTRKIVKDLETSKFIGFTSFR